MGTELKCLPRCWCLSLFFLPLLSLQLSLQLPLAPALEEIGERRLRKRIGSAQMERVVAPAPPTPVPMTASCEVRQELIITTPMGISFLPLVAGIAGTSAVAAGSVAVAANPGPSGSTGHLLDLLEQGHLEEAKTVTTVAPVVEVARCPLVGPWVPVSLATLVAAAVELQDSARIATRPRTASASSNREAAQKKILLKITQNAIKHVNP